MLQGVAGPPAARRHADMSSNWHAKRFLHSLRSVEMTGGSAVFFGPFDEGFELFIGEDFFQGVQFAAEVFFAVLLVNERMAAATHIDAAGAHVFAAEIFAEPFVFMAGSGDQVVEGDVLIGAAELANGFLLCHEMSMSNYN